MFLQTWSHNKLARLQDGHIRANAIFQTYVKVNLFGHVKIWGTIRPEPNPPKAKDSEIKNIVENDNVNVFV